MGLLVTTYLIAWNVYGSIDAPPSRGFSMVEVWITGVQCNILMAILEYLFVLALLRRETKSRKLQRVTKGIDFTFFICSIFYFTIFNLLYWTSMYKHDWYLHNLIFFANYCLFARKVGHLNIFFRVWLELMCWSSFIWFVQLFLPVIVKRSYQIFFIL